MTQELGQWIVGVDGSEGSDDALRWAEAHAPTRAKSIRLVRAWLVTVAGGSGDLGAQVMLEAEPHTAHADVDQLSARLGPLGVSVESAVEYGGPSEVLLGSTRDADLLVLGRRGLGGFRRLLVGSVSHQCATHARVPVVVVPTESRTDGRLGHVAVGFDGSPAAEAALSWALGFTSEATLIRVICAGWRTDVDTNIVDEGTDKSQLGLRSAVDRLVGAADRGSTVECVFVDGSPRDVLTEASSAADLLVVGERGHRGLSAMLLGSVTTVVLHRSSCPIVVIPVPPVDGTST